METTVTTKNMISIPQSISRKFGIEPGWKLDWTEGKRPDEIVIRVIPDRAERARRLLGAGKNWGTGRNAVAELVAERESEG
jgi:bifunctional DNA-binding transcriptional regulator/antitoxin component of YhaV-PrlF toxin-antitoxin module